MNSTMKTNPLLHTVTALLLATHFAMAADDAATLSRQGWQLWQSGKASEAIAKFQESVKLDPENTNAWNGLGWASFNSGQSAEAKKAFAKVLALAPDHAAALNGLGQIHLARREYAEAEPFLKKAAEQKASAAWFGLARLYLLQGKYADAEKWAQMIENSGQGNATATKMLEAAKAKELSEGLRLTIEPPAPGK
jgi:Flp pilus assembly protein TadD